jgi:hypothetical protein
MSRRQARDDMSGYFRVEDLDRYEIEITAALKDGENTLGSNMNLRG